MIPLWVPRFQRFGDPRDESDHIKLACTDEAAAQYDVSNYCEWRVRVNTRFRLALQNVEPAHWQPFENLSSQFLADEFGNLRTLASPSGDGGRDATLWGPEGDESVVIQYSTSTDWSAKIRRTVNRLKETFPAMVVLVYTSPHEIGARANELQVELRTRNRVHLDVRDRNWFVEREKRSATTVAAADWFSRLIIGALLADEKLIDRSNTVLSDEESRAALLYLVLQREDDDQDRHLTKLSYDALVRAALRDADGQNRMHRSAIHQEVHRVLPSHSESEVTKYVDLALTRLNKRFIRHWEKKDEFCLTFEERIRLDEGIARLKLADEAFEDALLREAHFVAEALGQDLTLVNMQEVTERLRRVLGRYLMSRGEAFVNGLRSGLSIPFSEAALESIVEGDLAQNADASSLRGSIVPLVTRTIERLLLGPTGGVRAYLRSIADGYTLFAFLRETPNVQSAVSKLFSHGEIWLDTTIVLPLLAEDLLDEAERSYSQLLGAVISSGGRLYVTTGVIEEISSHIDNSLRAARSPGTWASRTPFLLAAFTWAGDQLDDFPAWIENFRGAARPVDDLEEYLLDVLGIRRQDLLEEASDSDDSLRWHTTEHWLEVHERRRMSRGPKTIDPETIKILASHDVENFLGVIYRRQHEPLGNPFGYASWWLTLDGKAFEAAAAISSRCGDRKLVSPVLSFDFLTHYLAVGPARRQLEKSRERQLPLILDTHFADAMPTDLLAAAEAARASMKGQTERVIKRRVRDVLDAEKLRGGGVGRTTIDVFTDDIRLSREASR